ncbi:MAG TPA: alpha-amylase family glycosyl hydrolase [Anaerolineales bacterium]|nr:alpha-amylase family glycosyl hydrolase [Anaerolineales bacterium]
MRSGANEPKKITAMDKNGLDRRSFLRLCLIAAGGTLAAACKPIKPGSGPALTSPQPNGSETIPTSTSPLLTPTAVAPVEVQLEGSDADVWMWNRPVNGKVIGPDECQTVTVNVNGLNLEASREGANFSGQVQLSEGENHVVAICKRANGQEVTSQMLNFTERLRQKPKAAIRASLEDGKLVLAGAISQPDERDGAAIIEHIWSARPGNPAAVEVQGVDGMSQREFRGEVSGEHIILAPPLIDGEYYFSLRIVDQNGRQDIATTYVEVTGGKVRIPNYDKENPAWVEKAIIYGVIPRNFGSPGFKAIMEKLDYLQDLGVNALWLAPVNVSPDYGYSVVDYFELNPRNGTKEDFHRMVQEAHARGLRILMDFVPNHSSVEHPYFQDTLEHGEQSSYWDFYDRDENGSVTNYFDWTHLPNLNYDNPEVRRWMIEAFCYWVREFDVDGFRVDVAWGIRERRPDFWPEWRSELKRIKPDLLLLAEASARDPFYFDNGFDAAYDWTDQLGHWAWELVWDSYKHRLLTYNLHAALTNRPDGFHPDALIFRFLNNNDTGTRFITSHGEGMTRVATTLLLTLPGIPCIYTGDEVGEWFRPYYDPQPLTWEEKYPGLREYHKKLIALRKEIPSLHSRLWIPLNIPSIPQEVYGYIRYVEPSGQPVVVLLNFYEEPAEVEFELPEQFKSLTRQGSLSDRLADELIRVGTSDIVKVPVPGLSARILVERD